MTLTKKTTMTISHGLFRYWATATEIDQAATTMNNLFAQDKTDRLPYSDKLITGTGPKPDYTGGPITIERHWADQASAEEWVSVCQTIADAHPEVTFVATITDI